MLITGNSDIYGATEQDVISFLYNTKSEDFQIDGVPSERALKILCDKIDPYMYRPTYKGFAWELISRFDAPDFFKVSKSEVRVTYRRNSNVSYDVYIYPNHKPLSNIIAELPLPLWKTIKDKEVLLNEFNFTAEEKGYSVIIHSDF